MSELNNTPEINFITSILLKQIIPQNNPLSILKYDIQVWATTS